MYVNRDSYQAYNAYNNNYPMNYPNDFLSQSLYSNHNTQSYKGNNHKLISKSIPDSDAEDYREYSKRSALPLYLRSKSDSKEQSMIHSITESDSESNSDSDSLSFTLTDGTDGSASNSSTSYTLTDGSGSKFSKSSKSYTMTDESSNFSLTESSYPGQTPLSNSSWKQTVEPKSKSNKKSNKHAKSSKANNNTVLTYPSNGVWSQPEYTKNYEKTCPSTEFVYVTGPNTHRILPRDNTKVIYLNPISGPITVELGTEQNQRFEPNTVIVFKDITPEYSVNNRSSNVTIKVPMTGSRIEYYNSTGNIVAASNAGYLLNSAGGSVTLRYVDVGMVLPTWVIENQLYGNDRM
jgi:hypothetical protein